MGAHDADVEKWHQKYYMVHWGSCACQTFLNDYLKVETAILYVEGQLTGIYYPGQEHVLRQDLVDNLIFPKKGLLISLSSNKRALNLKKLHGSKI